MYKIHFNYIKDRAKMQVFFTTFAKNSEAVINWNIRKEHFEKKCSLNGCGSWIRTNDLRVMSPTSYPCSTPRYLYTVLMTLYIISQHLRFVKSFFEIFLIYYIRHMQNYSYRRRQNADGGKSCYTSVFLIPKKSLKKPAKILGVLQTTIFIICTSLSAKKQQP